MNRKYPASFILGVLISYLVIYYSVSFPAYWSEKNVEYTYKDRKFFSEINETRIIEQENLTLIFKASCYWRTTSFTPISGVTKLPYHFNLSIINTIDQIQWVESIPEYYQVSLYNETGYVGQIISLYDPTVDTMGIFLAPRGRHEIVSHWQGKYDGTRLGDGEYEIRFYTVINGEEILFDGIHFSVETRQVKIRKNIVS
ncbi:MAG: hypothetical protein NWF07_08250 [Candidatus Bathyarchaeota archaeon]|nr:hypothetical protein [Candidatus Bathyarchaeota archaeon]